MTGRRHADRHDIVNKEDNMKKTGTVRVLSIILVLCTILAGCSGSSQPSSASTTPAATTPASTTKAEATTAAKSGEVQRISFGSASVGGNYYVLGAGISAIWNQKVDGVEVTSEATGGSGANVGLVQNGDVQVAMTVDNTGYNGYNGLSWANGQKYDKIRTMIGLMPSALEIVAAKRANISSIYDMKKKTITIGPATSGGNLMALDLVATLNLEWGAKQDLGWSDAMSSVADGMIDACIDYGSFPHAARTELVANVECNWIELSPEDRAKMCSSYPYYFEGTMPAGTYKYMDSEYHTIMTYNIMFCHMDMDEDTIYKLTKAALENLDEWKLSSDSVKYVAAENILKCAVPLHPGAIRYYNEIGIEIPDNLYPPEYKKS